MKKRYMDRVASNVGKAGEFIADRETSKSLKFVERPALKVISICNGFLRALSMGTPLLYNIG